MCSQTFLGKKQTNYIILQCLKTPEIICLQTSLICSTYDVRDTYWCLYACQPTQLPTQWFIFINFMAGHAHTPVSVPSRDSVKQQLGKRLSALPRRATWTATQQVGTTTTRAYVYCTPSHQLACRRASTLAVLPATAGTDFDKSGRVDTQESLINLPGRNISCMHA